jgi:transcriptional regulator with XRE-family HTH domain
MIHNKPAVLRKKLDLSQTAFWGRLGITQSGGSRYENGHVVPRYLQLLLELTYGKNPLKALKRIRGNLR